MNYRKLVSILGLLTCAASSQAAPITLYGDTVNYQYDDVSNAAALALFGTPTIVGDTVRFIPPSFRVESVDGVGIATVGADFVFDRVYSLNDADIIEIMVMEIIDYQITGGGTARATLSLSAESNSGPDSTAGQTSLSASGDSGGLQVRQLATLINPADVFVSAANDLELTIGNTLRAGTENFGEIAWLQKKLAFTAAVAGAAPVPAPGVLWLLCSGLLAMGLTRRRPA